MAAAPLGLADRGKHAKGKISTITPSPRPQLCWDRTGVWERVFIASGRHLFHRIEA